MSNFVNLARAVQTMATDESTANQPIRRMFVADGEYLSANVSVLETTENALHTQGFHDEIVVVIEGDVEFGVEPTSRYAAVASINTLSGK